MPRRGHLGASALVYLSPAAAKRRREARLEQERRWAERSGPVTVVTTRENGDN